MSTEEGTPKTPADGDESTENLTEVDDSSAPETPDAAKSEPEPTPESPAEEVDEEAAIASPWSRDAITEWQSEPETDAEPAQEWEYSDRALFGAIVSAPALALAAFAFSVAGLLGGAIPEALPYLVQADAASGPSHHVRIVGVILLGFAIVSASLGLAALLRSVGSSLMWPRYIAGGAVLIAFLTALQSVLLLVLAAFAPQGPPR